MMSAIEIKLVRSMTVAASLWLTVSAAGCGEATDATDPTNAGSTTEDLGSEFAAASRQTFTITCPPVVTATWIQAPNGNTNLIRRQTERFVTVAPVQDLICSYFPGKPAAAVTQFVKLQPRSQPSLCAGKVTFTGQGSSVGGVPPFGGYIFKSKRITATSTYDFTSGDCDLSAPAPSIPTGQLSIRMSKGCTTANDSFTYVCPIDALVVN